MNSDDRRFPHSSLLGILALEFRYTALIFVLAAGVALADQAAGPTTPTPSGLTCQLLPKTAVPGITDSKPKLGWIVPLAKRGDRQAAYQILAASSKELLAGGRADLWDSGKVESAESINVAYAGSSLAAGQSWCWNVRTWSQDGMASDWSAVQSVTMAAELGTYATPRFPLEATEVEPLKIQRTGDNKYFVDFGKDAFGFLRLDIDAQSGSPSMVVRFGEKTGTPSEIDRKPGGSIRYGEVEANLEASRQIYNIHPKVDQRNTTGAAIRLPQEFGVVTPFRYVELENCPFELKRSEIRQVTVHYPF